MRFHKPPPPRQPSPEAVCPLDRGDCWTPRCCPEMGCLKAIGQRTPDERRFHAAPVIDLPPSEWRRVKDRNP